MANEQYEMAASTMPQLWAIVNSALAMKDQRDRELDESNFKKATTATQLGMASTTENYGRIMGLYGAHDYFKARDKQLADAEKNKAEGITVPIQKNNNYYGSTFNTGSGEVSKRPKWDLYKRHDRVFAVDSTGKDPNAYVTKEAADIPNGDNINFSPDTTPGLFVKVRGLERGNNYSKSLNNVMNAFEPLTLLKYNIKGGSVLGNSGTRFITYDDKNTAGFTKVVGSAGKVFDTKDRIDPIIKYKDGRIIAKEILDKLNLSGYSDFKAQSGDHKAHQLGYYFGGTATNIQPNLLSQSADYNMNYAGGDTGYESYIKKLNPTQLLFKTFNANNSTGTDKNITIDGMKKTVNIPDSVSLMFLANNNLKKITVPTSNKDGERFNIEDSGRGIGSSDKTFYNSIWGN